jgi:hypothetical protein
MHPHRGQVGYRGSSSASVQARVPDTAEASGAVQIMVLGLPHVQIGVVVNVKKIVGLLAIALLLFFVFTQPDTAAGSLQSIGTTLRNGAESVIQFFTALV